MVPKNHLLKKIDKYIDFSFIYELARPYYSDMGRKSVDAVVMVKMLLIGYLYGIKSGRRLVEEIHLNIGHRWFCGFNIEVKFHLRTRADTPLYRTEYGTHNRHLLLTERSG